MRERDSIGKSMELEESIEKVGIIWKDSSGFHVSYNQGYASVCVGLEEFIDKNFYNERTKIIYSAFMNNDEKAEAEEILNSYRFF